MLPDKQDDELSEAGTAAAQTQASAAEISKPESEHENIYFKTLSKAERKKLRKEYNKTPEAKRLGWVFIIFASIWAAVMITSSIASAVRESDWNGTIFSSFFLPMFIFFIIMIEDAYRKWLKKEKNIVRKMPKNKKPKE